VQPKKSAKPGAHDYGQTYATQPFLYFFILELLGGPLGAEKYKFGQFHFHWGAKDSEGSEHRQNGKMFPAEVIKTKNCLKSFSNVQNIL